MSKNFSCLTRRSSRTLQESTSPRHTCGFWDLLFPPDNTPPLPWHALSYMTAQILQTVAQARLYSIVLSTLINKLIGQVLETRNQLIS